MTGDEQEIRFGFSGEIDLADLSRRDPRVRVGDAEAELADPGIVERIAELERARQAGWKPVPGPEGRPR